MFYRKGFRREPNHILGLLKHDIFSKRVDILTKKLVLNELSSHFSLGELMLELKLENTVSNLIPHSMPTLKSSN